MRNIDQARAEYAWACVQGCSEKYVNLVKGAPALIMTSGLMQTLAFYAGKNEAHHKHLLDQICRNLLTRFPRQVSDGDFRTVMQAMYVADPRFYQQATEETMELLRWLRQFAAAVNGDQ